MKAILSIIFDLICKRIAIPIWILLILSVGAISFHTFTIKDVKDDYIQVIKTKDALISDKDSEIDKLNDKISEKDGAVAVLNDTISRQNDEIQELNDLYNSQQIKDKLALEEANRKAAEAELKMNKMLSSGSGYSDDCDGGMKWLKDSASFFSF